MDKGRKKLEQFIEKIKGANEKILNKRIQKIVSLKKSRFKSVDLSALHSKAATDHQVLLHPDTHNFPHTREHVLQLLKKFSNEYPFLDLHISKDNLTTVVVKVFWADYCNSVLKPLNRPSQLPKQGVAQNSIKFLCDKNARELKNALNNILNTAKKSKTCEYTDSSITLNSQTMLNPQLRRHFLDISHQMQEEYPFIEIFRTSENIVNIRIWWELYYYYIQLTPAEQEYIPLDNEARPSAPSLDLTDKEQINQMLVYPPTQPLPTNYQNWYGETLRN